MLELEFACLFLCVEAGSPRAPTLPTAMLGQLDQPIVRNPEEICGARASAYWGLVRSKGI